MFREDGQFAKNNAYFTDDELAELKLAMLMRRQQSEVAWSQLKGTAQAREYAERLLLVYGILVELGLQENRAIEEEVRKSLEKDND